jgi:formate hydrogenlyase subunit 6/NADH:ubiquinone oxidoreductase subunit I
MSQLLKYYKILEFKEEICNGCGGCSWVCPQDAILVRDVEKKREINLSYDKCDLCAQCVEACPVKAIEIKMAPVESNRGKKFTLAQVPLDQCVKCGKIIGPTLLILALKGKASEIEVRLCAACRRRVVAGLVSEASKVEEEK